MTYATPNWPTAIPDIVHPNGSASSAGDLPSTPSTNTLWTTRRLIFLAEGSTGDCLPAIRIAAALHRRGYNVEAHISKQLDWLIDNYHVPGAASLSDVTLGEDFRGLAAVFKILKKQAEQGARGAYQTLKQLAAPDDTSIVMVSFGTFIFCFPLLHALVPGRWALVDPIHFADIDTGYPSSIIMPYNTHPTLARLGSRLLITILNLFAGFFRRTCEAVLNEEHSKNPQLLERLRKATFNPRDARFRIYPKTLDGSIQYARDNVVLAPLAVGSALSSDDNDTSLHPNEEAFFTSAKSENARVIAISFGSLKPYDDQNKTAEIILESARLLQAQSITPIRLFYVNTQNVDPTRFNIPSNCFISQGYVNWPEIARRADAVITHGGAGHTSVVDYLKRPSAVFYSLSEQKHNALRTGATYLHPMKNLSADTLAWTIRALAILPRGNDCSRQTLNDWLNGHELVADEILRQIIRL